MINELITLLPIQIYIGLFSIFALYLIWMVYLLFSTRFKIKQTIKDIFSIIEELSYHQGCHIENLPLISDVFDAAPKRFSSAYKDMINTSVELYQKKWIPNPHEFFNLKSLLDSKTTKKLNGLSFLYFLLLGALLFISTMVLGLFLFNTPDQIRAIIILSLIPLLFGLSFGLIFFIEKARNKSDIKLAIDEMIHVMSQKLPVFNEYNGLALLINQFLEYDRNMNKSVEKLSDQIDNLVMDGLKNAIVDSIERTLLESVAPSIERATNAIVSLSNDVMEKEENGMKDLALKFSSALSEELYYQLDPLIKQVSEVSNTLSNSKNYLDIASQSLDAYKKNALELQDLTSKTLLSYEESKASFTNDINSIAISVENLSQTANSYSHYVDINQKSFMNSSADLRDSIKEAQNSLQQLLEGIFKQSQSSQAQAMETQAISEEYLTKMKEQIDSFIGGFNSYNQDMFNGLKTILSDFISEQTSKIYDQNNKLNESSIEMFSSINNATKDINLCTKQIKNSFDEIEAARRIEEENAKNRKHGFFGKQK